jgi:hypothetical protein
VYDASVVELEGAIGTHSPFTHTSLHLFSHARPTYPAVQAHVASVVLQVPYPEHTSTAAPFVDALAVGHASSHPAPAKPGLQLHTASAGLHTPWALHTAPTILRGHNNEQSAPPAPPQQMHWPLPSVPLLQNPLPLHVLTGVSCSNVPGHTLEQVRPKRYAAGHAVHDVPLASHESPQ